MSPGAVAVAIILAIVAVGVAFGFFAAARRKMDLEQWSVAGRGFGLLLVYLLMAGEIYTVFSFLGASGWAYSRGGPTLYILTYSPLAYVISFFILPRIWEMGRKYRLQTQSDFFLVRYRSQALAGFVCIAGIVLLVPYLQLQLTGLGIIVSIASFDAIKPVTAMVVSVVLLAAFVSVGGIRAVAWVSVAKDALMIIATLSIGIGIPLLHFGGIGQMFKALERARPIHLTMPGATTDLGHGWYISTVLLCSLGFYMWPHSFAAAFTARSSETLRRNAVVMPLYNATLAFVLFAGFAAVLLLPGLGNGDLALLTLVRKSFPPWFLGVIGGAGALTAMVPAAIFLVSAATLFTKNFYRPIFAPTMTDRHMTMLARVTVLMLCVLSLYFAVYTSTTLVALLLLGYAGVAQFFPGVVLGLYWTRVTRTGVLAGIICGFTVAIFLFLTKRDPWFGWSAGFLALCLNFLVTVLLSLSEAATDKRFAVAE